MRFLFLIHGDDEAEAALSLDARRAIVGEHLACGAMLRKRGAYVLGEALELTGNVPPSPRRCDRGAADRGVLNLRARSG